MYFRIFDVPLVYITDNPWQTRTEYDPERIEELAQDISRNRLLQPPVGRLISSSTMEAVGPEYFRGRDDIVLRDKIAEGALLVELACGHSRLRAVRLLAQDGAMGAIPVSIRELSDDDMAQMAWAENAQRNDITPWEQALALERRCSDLGWTHKQCAERLGLARSTVSGKIRLLRLPEEAKAAYAEGSITERQAQALLSVYEDDCDQDIFEAASKGYNSPDNLLEHAVGGMSADEISRRWRNEIEWRTDAKKARLEREAARTDQSEEVAERERERKEAQEKRAQERAFRNERAWAALKHYTATTERVVRDRNAKEILLDEMAGSMRWWTDEEEIETFLLVLDPDIPSSVRRSLASYVNTGAQSDEKELLAREITGRLSIENLSRALAAMQLACNVHCHIDGAWSLSEITQRALGLEG